MVWFSLLSDAFRYVSNYVKTEDVNRSRSFVCGVDVSRAHQFRPVEGPQGRRKGPLLYEEHHSYYIRLYCVAYHVCIIQYINIHIYYIYMYMYLMYVCVCVCQQQMLKEKLWTLRRVKDSFSFFNAQCSGRCPIGMEASTASLNIGVSFSKNVIYPQHQTRKRLNPIWPLQKTV